MADAVAKAEAGSFDFENGFGTKSRAPHPLVSSTSSAVALCAVITVIGVPSQEGIFARVSMMPMSPVAARKLQIAEDVDRTHLAGGYPPCASAGTVFDASVRRDFKYSPANHYKRSGYELV